MRILLITQIYPGYKGETTQTSPFSIHYFAKEWKRLGHDVEVIRIWPYRPLPFSLFMNRDLNEHAYKETFELDNLKIHRIPIRKIPGINFTNFDIKKAFSKLNLNDFSFEPDLILCHAISPNLFIGVKYGEVYKNKPVFLTIHKTDLSYLSKKSNRNTFDQYKKNLQSIFFRSPVLKEKYESLLNEEVSENVIIPSGISEKEILKYEEFDKKAKKPSYNFIIACSLIKLKNIDILIKTFDILTENFSNINLKIIGDGPERANLENMTQKRGLESHVEFLGHLGREEVLKHMSASDIFVMISSPETFGLVYIEAMSQGCIVIGSKGEGIDGIVENGKNGFLCNVNDINELVGIITHCINMSQAEKGQILNASYETIRQLTNKKCANHYLNELKKRL